jgi:hypothetical protein
MNNGANGSGEGLANAIARLAVRNILITGPRSFGWPLPSGVSKERRGCVMAIYRILRNSTFGPRDISRMTTAYEVALIELGIDRADPRTEIIASGSFTEPA